MDKKERAMKRIVPKLKNKAGFTLAETMLAVVMLVLITASALPAAMTAYRNAIDAANAHALLSTTVDALRGELSTAWDVTVNEKTVTYKSSDTGSRSVLNLAADPFSIKEYDDFDDQWLDNNSNNIVKPSERTLVTRAMAGETRNPGNTMKVVLADTGKIEAATDDNYITITGLEVQRDGKTITKMPDDGLVIRYLGGD